MNVTFNLDECGSGKRIRRRRRKRNLIGIKGHRSLGGCRASIYNAVTEEACQALADFMDAFRKQH
jgi:phosphoserine aminotransferase